MSSNIIRKIAIAIIATLIAEAIEKILDAMEVTEEDSRLLREITKAVVVAIAMILVENVIDGPEARW
jgi:hypothetical protein